MITSTAGTGVSITLKDGSGNTVASALTTLTAQTLPVGFRINFGAFSVSSNAYGLRRLVCLVLVHIDF